MEIGKLTLTDPVYKPGRISTNLSKILALTLNDSRNLPFAYFIILLLLTTVPFGIALFFPHVFHWYIALPYFILNSIFFMGPFILMQHNAAHKTLFKRKYKFLNNIIPWIIGPFFGLTPETYFAHHIGMHHPENNLPDDLSTTMKYKRDSIKDFSKYLFKFLFLGIAQLALYLRSKKRNKILNRMLLGELSYYVVMIILLFINWKATLIVFLIPMVFTRFMMMAGNWAQHAFIDKNEPSNCYKNSITCINSHYNKTCFNDGYHIGHHLYPSLHWSEMPEELQRNIEKYISNDALVFRKLDYFIIWFLLMTNNYSLLSKFYVELNPEKPRAKEEIIDFLKSRTQRII